MRRRVFLCAYHLGRCLWACDHLPWCRRFLLGVAPAVTLATDVIVGVAPPGREGQGLCCVARPCGGARHVLVCRARPSIEGQRLVALGGEARREDVLLRCPVAVLQQKTAGGKGGLDGGDDGRA